jgi:hypothetical protein
VAAQGAETPAPSGVDRPGTARAGRKCTRASDSCFRTKQAANRAMVDRDRWRFSPQPLSRVLAEWISSATLFAQRATNKHSRSGKMKTFRWGMIAIGLLAGTSVTLAAEMTSVKPHDHLGLTNNQQQTIYQDLSKKGEKATVPTSFKAAVGETVPGNVKLRMMPADVAKQVPAVKSYDFAALRNEILIVDRSSKKIVDIINRS